MMSGYTICKGQLFSKMTGGNTPKHLCLLDVKPLPPELMKSLGQLMGRFITTWIPTPVLGLFSHVPTKLCGQAAV